ncbi:hypothetical protein N5B55_04755 [Ralstonia pickettii]|uniref:hypothetical protein n=1 Tax=Ralstonia pickettii TaxID=329 RepID=UPI00271551ED|nr:hypothetical protein [Ralstonia pickettii]WKZ86263.1 hypothetical protein N5B55_04755 [Ralstonia pickettii]
MSPIEQERFARANRKLAEEKIREEIRNAVRAALTKEGLNGAEIKQAISETIKEMVDKRAKIALRDPVFVKRMDEVIERHIKEAFGGMDVGKAIKDLLIEQARAAATKFVHERVLINVRDQEFGSF